MLLDQRLELADELRAAPARQVRVDSLLQSLQPLLLEPPNRRLRKRLECQILQRRPAPQSERSPQPLGAVARLRHPPRVRDEPLEPRQVEPLRVDAQDVAARLGHEHLPPERLP